MNRISRNFTVGLEWPLSDDVRNTHLQESMRRLQVRACVVSCGHLSLSVRGRSQW